MPPITLEIVKQSLSKLPTLPSHMAKILQTINKEDLDINELTKCVSCEPALVARLLRVSNSPFYGIKGTVSSVTRAIQILGFANVKQVVNALILISGMPIEKNIADMLGNFWQEAIMVAVLSDNIAAHLHSNTQNQAFTAGLLHDFGRLTLATWYPDVYVSIVQGSLENEGQLAELERQQFGIDHCEVGALLAEQWNFPSDLCAALRYHHIPEKGTSQLAWILFIADIMYGSSNDTEADVDERVLKALEREGCYLSLQIPDCKTIIEDSLHKTEAYVSML